MNYASSTLQQRIALSSIFLVLGFELGAWAVSLPSTKYRMGLTYGQVGVTLLVLGISSLASMSSSPRLMARFGERRVLLFGGLAFGLSALGPAAAKTWSELLAAATVLGLSNGFFDASQNALSVHLERAVGRPIIISFHAWFSAGGLLAALVGSATLKAGVDTRVLLTGTAVVAVSSILAVSRWLPRPVEVAPAIVAVHERPRIARRGLLALGVLAFAMFAAEGAAYDWANLELRSVIGAPPNTAALAFGAFSLGMLGLRLTADKVVAKVGPARYFRVAACVGAVGFAVAITSTSSVVAIAGWAVTGVGIAGCIPLLFAAAGNLDPVRSSAYVARAAAFGYCGFLAGPSIIGFAAQLTNLRLALVIPLGFCLLCAAFGNAVKPRGPTLALVADAPRGAQAGRASPCEAGDGPTPNLAERPARSAPPVAHASDPQAAKVAAAEGAPPQAGAIGEVVEAAGEQEGGEPHAAALTAEDCRVDQQRAEQGATTGAEAQRKETEGLPVTQQETGLLADGPTEAAGREASGDGGRVALDGEVGAQRSGGHGEGHGGDGYRPPAPLEHRCCANCRRGGESGRGNGLAVPDAEVGPAGAVEELAAEPITHVPAYVVPRAHARVVPDREAGRDEAPHGAEGTFGAVAGAKISAS